MTNLKGIVGTIVNMLKQDKTPVREEAAQELLGAIDNVEQRFVLMRGNKDKYFTEMNDVLYENQILIEQMATLHDALLKAKEEFGKLPHSLGYTFDHLPTIDHALELSAETVSKHNNKIIKEVVAWFKERGHMDCHNAAVKYLVDHQIR